MWSVTRSIPAVAASMGLLALMSCASTGGGGGAEVSRGGFQAQYVSARADLESGRFKSAMKRYSGLIKSSGSFQPRMMLELSHAQLRAGDLDAAARTAQQVSQSESGTMRAAALAVLGTAEHEMGRGRAKAGKYDNQTQAHFLRAAGALDEMLRDNGAMDATGGMKKRRAAIAEDMRVYQGLGGSNG